MNAIIHTWEDEAIPTGEIELTDAQLAAVYGAWGEECEPQCEEEEPCQKFGKEVRVHVAFAFEFEAEFKKKEFKKDCDW